MFLKLLNISISASWVVLAVIVLRLVLKKAPKSIHCILWALVAFRLICPISLESDFSLMPSTEAVPEEYLYMEGPDLDDPAVIEIVDNPVFPEQIEVPLDTSVSNVQTNDVFWTINWFVGMGIMTLYAIISYLIVRRKAAASVPAGKNIRLCDHIDSPFILGIINPKIYLPSSLDQQTAEHVLAHEKAHLQRKDHWWKPLGFALLTVHWFNPVIWLAYVLLCRDIEMACDEKVIQKLDCERKKSYSQALLQCSVPRRLIAACPLAFGEVGVKERIRSVLNYKKPAFWLVVVAVIACIVAAVCFLTDPADKTSPYRLTNSLETGDIERVQVTLWEDENAHITLSNTQVEALVKILNSLTESDFQEERAIDHHISVMILMGEKAIGLQYDGERVEFLLDSESAEAIDGQNWSVSVEELNEFIGSFDRSSADHLLYGSYVCFETVYWPLYSSTLPPVHGPYNFLAYEEGISYYSSSNGDVLSVAPIEWKWQTLAECYEDVFFYTEWYKQLKDVLDEDVPVPSDDMLYQPLNGEHLLIQDTNGALYIVEGTNQGRKAALEYVDAIYQVGMAELTSESSNEETVGHTNLTTAINSETMDQYMYHKPEHSGGWYFGSHTIVSQLVACGVAPEGATEPAPTGYTKVCIIAMVICVEEYENGYHVISREMFPAILTFDEYTDGSYVLSDYQQPEAGTDLMSYIQENFSPVAQENLMTEAEYFDLLEQKCLEQAEKHFP